MIIKEIIFNGNISKKLNDMANKHIEKRAHELINQKRLELIREGKYKPGITKINVVIERDGAPPITITDNQNTPFTPNKFTSKAPFKQKLLTPNDFLGIKPFQQKPFTPNSVKPFKPGK